MRNKDGELDSTRVSNEVNQCPTEKRFIDSHHRTYSDTSNSKSDSSTVGHSFTSSGSRQPSKMFSDNQITNPAEPATKGSSINHQNLTANNQEQNVVNVKHYPCVRPIAHCRHSSAIVTTTHYPIAASSMVEVKHLPFESNLFRCSTLPSGEFSYDRRAHHIDRHISFEISHARHHQERLSASLRLPHTHTDYSDMFHSLRRERRPVPHAPLFLPSDSSIQTKSNYFLPRRRSSCNEVFTVSKEEEQNHKKELYSPESNTSKSCIKAVRVKSYSCKLWGSKKKRIRALVALLMAVCALVIATLCYFVIAGSSNKEGNNLNAKDMINITTTAIPGLKGELSQIQYCGAYPAKYIYAFDGEKSTQTLSAHDSDLPPVPPTEDDRIMSTSSSEGLLQRGPNQPVIRNPRVVGGRNTPPGTVPWQASLWVKYIGMICGGSVIMKNWILTAAHCTIEMSDPLGWDVYVGMTKLSDKRVSPGVRKNVIKIIQHENYVNDSSYDYDISLVQLETDLEYSEFIQPICIPPQSYVFPDGMSCYVSGWGALSSEESAPDANYLQRARINIIKNETCEQWNKGWVTTRMICAGEPDGGKDACDGDSGGPLSCYDSEKGVWMLAGSVSWGEGCGQPKRPGVYAKISFFSEWIWTKIGKTEGWIDEDAVAPKVTDDRR